MGKYDKFKKIKKVYDPIAEEADKEARDKANSEYQEVLNFDWGTTNPESFERNFIYMQENESEYDRKKRMLKQLSIACLACSMCGLGRKQAANKNELRDPHVFSNVNPTEFMLIMDSPTWSDVKNRRPLSSGSLEKEFKKNGLSSSDFYVNYLIRCHSKEKESDSYEKCESFLRMEVDLIKPKLIIAVGAQVYNKLCPGLEVKPRKVVKSEKYKTNIFAILDITDISLLSKLISRLKVER